MWYVYFLKSVNYNFRYVGSTNNLNRRFEEHNLGLSQATAPYKPFKIETHIAVQSEKIARNLEKYFKTGSGKAFYNKRFVDNNA